MLNNLAFAASRFLGLNQSSLLDAGLMSRSSGDSSTPLDTFETFSAPSPAPTPPHAPRTFAPALIAAGLAAFTPATALAQNPGLENLAAIAPGLPPTWQMAVGGLLYAEPAIRATARSLRKIISWFSRPQPSPDSPPAQSLTVVQKINEATGRVERVMGPARDVIVPAIIGAQMLFSDRPLSSFVPEAIALGLSLWSHRDRTGRVEQAIIRNQLNSEQRLLPSGWRTQEARALGVLAPDVVEKFPEEHLDGGTRVAYAQGAKPGFSLWRNIRALGTTVSMLTGVMRRSHVYIEGTYKTFLSWKESIRPGRHAPMSEKYLAAVDIMLPQWVMRLSEHYGVTLSFRGLDRLKTIPEGAPVVFSAFPHSAIFTDFLFWHALPRARFVADKKNFHDSKIIRAIGLAWFLDVIGLPFVSRAKNNGNGAVNSRGSLPPASVSSIPPALPSSSTPPSPSAPPSNGSNNNLYSQTTDRMAKYGIQPVFFGQAGRAPRAFRDDRSLGRPGLYANVLDPRKPERYYNLLGTIHTALAAARQSGQDAYIPILHIEGSGRVMPKISKNPPFIQPVQPGEVTFSIGDILRVRPDSNIAELTREIIEAAKRATGINEFLQKEVARWAGQAGTPEAAQDFKNAADANETYYIIADRIRSVHPNLPRRNEFKSRLLGLARRAAVEGSVTEDLLNLLQDVSRVVKQTEYQKA